ncbi:methionyl-tRNA formyltransferase [Serpentinicella sp. ANB-PHB4]|uniref:methionyl-tRNA formyltransferase n=1 Tax=Serpentinicella sp. ANB-PHB4 TaxID=3074076 RepID=UPI0028630B97|nr:methionyl-tRNA formyltransferase [Serpentinicella sp. ANB-PHB4]MDR5658323.1 methionyl-tRNA formyltransferase [Serpentinicella sp. ANB-PHB4]
MKVLFMGTPDFAVPCLEKLVDEKYDVVGVFTQPDKPKGRGKRLVHTPVKDAALKHGLKVYQPTKIREETTINLIKQLVPEVIIVVAYGQILPKSILDLPLKGCINVHASLLPKYRGAAPINWAIINGESITGITTMYMDEGLDTGDMILKESIDIHEDDTAGDLHDKLANLGSELLIKTLEDITNGKLRRVKQDDKEATYCQKLTKDLGEIDWCRPAKEIRNLVRGTIPWPTAYTTYLNKKMKVWKTSVIKGEHNYRSGTIIDITQNGIDVATGKDILRIQELQFSGGKRLKVEDFLRGNTIDKNIILGE